MNHRIQYLATAAVAVLATFASQAKAQTASPAKDAAKTQITVKGQVDFRLNSTSTGVYGPVKAGPFAAEMANRQAKPLWVLPEAKPSADSTCAKIDAAAQQALQRLHVPGTIQDRHLKIGDWNFHVGKPERTQDMPKRIRISSPYELSMDAIR